MRTAIAAIAGAAAALVAAGALGVAAAEGPTVSASGRTVTVEGVANVPVPQGASAAVATGVYRQAMAAAVADGQAKAEYLAGKVGATLGPVQHVAEAGGNITCTDSGESSYAEYQGEQPDFGYTTQATFAGTATPSVSASRPASPPKRHHRHSAPAAKKASVSCTLSAQVGIVYSIG